MIAAACAGFLIAVLWMDLIFDSQVLRHRGADVLPEPVLASICSYYRRATTTSRPMSYLIALVMVRTVRSAVRLGTRADDRAEQSRLARAVCLDHLVCLACMSGFLAVWLTRSG